MQLELTIQPIEFGKKCSNCKKIRKTIYYTIQQDKSNLINFFLCDECQNKAFSFSFSPRISPNITKKERKRQIKISQNLEKKVALDVQGKVQPGSGNQDAKADIRKINKWRIEHKYTNSNIGYRLLVNSLSSIIRHANSSGEWPALVINFRRISKVFTVLPYELFLFFVEKFDD
jgi:hypothetical protein